MPMTPDSYDCWGHRAARGRIARYKIPRCVIAVDEFPMTVTGKVQKFKPREAAISDLGLDADQVIAGRLRT